jgi:hypothetical protein
MPIILKIATMDLSIKVLPRHLIILFATIILVWPINAWAYFDPGTGTLMIQALIGAIAMLGAGIGVYWKKIKNIFRGDGGKKAEATENSPDDSSSND